MENAKKELVERIKQANNVLVTVSANPSVDQLSAAIGLTLMLNKLGKHATAVFSGEVPSTIEFLEPDKTLEKNTDSLRDFIIALDKSKADKLRYKVEDSHVKIFITPYRTSITEKDLEFSQGDFNVEVVVALGVKEQADLDRAITAHGRILHDATTVSVMNGDPSTLGAINWSEPSSSSLCEMVASLAEQFQKDLLDGQMATALMTGIVAETDRFSNSKTSPVTMSVSAALMASGANQQLVASKLQEDLVIAASVPNAPDQATKQSTETNQNDGSLDIQHNESPLDTELPEVNQDDEPPVEQIHIDEDGTVQSATNDEQKAEENPSTSAIQGGSPLILEPPSLGGKLTANSEPEHLDPSIDPLSPVPNDRPILRRHKDQDLAEPVTSAEPQSPVVPDAQAAELPVEPPAPTPAFVMPEQTDTPLPEPTMDLPSETPQSPLVTALPSPSEQSIMPPADTAAEPSAVVSEPADDGPQTLSDLEAAVKAAAEPAQPVDTLLTETPAVSQRPLEPAPEPQESTTASLDTARDAVSNALASMQNQPLPPIDALNAQPLDLEIKQTGETGKLDEPSSGFTMPDNLVPDTGLPADMTATPVNDPTAPPSVPPPFMPDMNGFTPPPTPGDENTQPPVGNPQNPFGLPPA